MITSSQLIDTLVSAGVRKEVITPLDSSYVMPDPAWVAGALGQAMRDFLNASGINYTSEQFDCNHFSKAAATIADWSWARTKSENAALAFGMFGYFSLEAMGLHCINVAVHRNPNGNLYAAFYEPQPTPTLCLQSKPISQDEIGSCVFCLFA